MQCKTSIGSRIGICSVSVALFGCASPLLSRLPPARIFAGEGHFKTLRQLTFGGTNAEAYWSFDGKSLVFQHKGKWLPGGVPGEPADGPACDQMYSVRQDGSELTPLSRSSGRNTCGYFTTDDSHVLFSSTMASGKDCPAPPDMSQGYVWPIYNSYKIYSAKPDGSDLFPAEPDAPKAYTAETTICRDGSVVFTSDRDGDLELYVGKQDKLGTIREVQRVTRVPGYDGGAFFSPDCSKLVWRASRPRPGKELDEYRDLLKQHLVKPGELELWTADRDGSHARQLTRIGAASFAPFFTPDGKRVIFSSNRNHPGTRQFDLFMIDLNGTRLEQVTHSGSFDSFPMFSPDGTRLAFSSNRGGTEPHETNVFVAEWQPMPEAPIPLDSNDAAERFQAVVEKLAAPDMEGRAAGTKGAKLAEELVAERFKAAGLKPFFETFPKTPGGTGYLQETPIRSKTGALEAHNVLGTWGEGCGKVAPVVIGAHLDHLGQGGTESLEPTQKGLHPGADDNASGVAALLEAARMVAEATAGPSSSKQACFIYAAFSGEEVAIVGSSILAKRLVAMKQTPRAMLNFDMVGRMEQNKLIVFGTDSAKEWKKMVAKACEERRLSCPGGGDGYGPSDHMAFYVEGVPVLHFFTGPHLDYHRTTDTADKINATGGVQAAEAAAAVALESMRTRFHYQKATPRPAMGQLLAGDKKSPGSRAYLGTIPDYSTLMSPNGPGGGGEPNGGVKLAGTRPGSPAARAGVRAGDVLMGIGDSKIATLEEFTLVLTKLKPGDQVELKIRRGQEFLKLPATVGTREGPAPEGAHP